ncbi:MAG: hypothetical protein IJ463_01180 [Bacilli bacterium]|nr:hypothetical protein [Bacilli bacterium]
MGESNVEAASVISDIWRTIMSVLDRPAYWLLGIMYQLFFNVASADLFSNDTIMKFYGRVQLILGVFMMFKLAMTILKGIVEPEEFFGGKKGGTGGAFVSKVIKGLIILTLLMPISIPGASNEYEIQINNNGILFGTLYSLQHRLLANNTLARFILGNDDMAEDYGNDTDELKKSARIFTSSILKGFYRINLLPEDERPKHEDGKDDAVFNDNRVCKDIDDDVLKAYTRLDADPGKIISMVNLTCEGDAQSGGAFNSLLGVISPKLAGKTYYVFSYMPFFSMIVPLIFVFILLSFTIDVAVRSVKLAVLRLIAPIPVISYMDPKEKSEEKFNTWVKTLTSTYLDLFIRLAAVYFAIFLIQDMLVNGVVINNGSGVIGVISLILIWIGIFVFAKQAPKFIKDVLGLKGDGGKLFGGFGELGAALGIGAGIAGSIGSGIAGYRASKMADETRESLGENVDPTSTLNRGKHLLAGIAGGLGGGYAGVKAAMTAKDHGFRASVEAMRKHNDAALARGNSGSTLLGRMGSTASSIFAGEGSSVAMSREIETLTSQKKAMDAVKSRMSGEMVKKDWTYGAVGSGITDLNGGNLDGVRVNYKDFMARYTAAQSSNASDFEIIDEHGGSHRISTIDAEKQKGFILKMNEDDYIQRAADRNGPDFDVELYDLIEDARIKGAFGRIGDPSNPNDQDAQAATTVINRAAVTTRAEAVGRRIRSRTRQNDVNKANDQFAGKK